MRIDDVITKLQEIRKSHGNVDMRLCPYGSEAIISIDEDLLIVSNDKLTILGKETKIKCNSILME